MSNRTATVIPADGLNLREAPSPAAAILGLLAAGLQVTITARRDAWRRVESPLGPGFVHGDFITVDGDRTVNEEPPGLDIEIPDAELQEPDDRTGEPAPVQFYTVIPGDTLSGIGTKLGLNWRDIADANGISEPFIISVNQVLRLPGASVRVAAIRVWNPLPGPTVVTSSSAQGHHRPYGGTHSCDLDVRDTLSSGTPVRFNVAAPADVELRGIVRLIGPGCRSGLISDGGSKVQINLQYRPAGTVEWQNTGAWVLYSHLDPVLVSVDQELLPGAQVGALGPDGGGEYASSCAQGSHVHVEVTRGTWVIDLHTETVDGTVLAVAI